MTKFFPFMKWIHLVNRESIRADIIAGFTGAVIVLPQGVAFAAIAGLPPEYGLYTAMVTPIVAALFGSSLHLISGPTTAISIVVFSTVSGYAEPGSAEYLRIVLTITFLAGLYQFVFGIARLGTIVNFVSHTVVIGFTAGAAILIATSQIKHVIGIPVPRGGSFLDTWKTIFGHIGEANYHVFAVAMFTLILAVAIKKFVPKLPNLLLGLIGGSALAIALGGTESGIKLVGQIPAQLPPLSKPDLSLETIKQLAPGAFAIALLGLIEAVSISRSVASKSNQRIDGNQEFIGQGLSNIVGSFFSSYAGSGSFTRSGINYTAGAQTPLSALFAAGFLALIVLLIAPLTAYLPIAAMGGVILIVAYNLIDFHHITKILKISKSETAILLTTFLATLFLHLEFAIYFGVLLSLLIFLTKTSAPEIVTLAPTTKKDNSNLLNAQKKNLTECPQLKILRIDMSIYFGSLTSIQNKLHQITDEEKIKHILLIGSSINMIDMSGAEMLVSESKRLQKMGGGLYIDGLKSKVCDYVKESNFMTEFGKENFFQDRSVAIATIFDKLNKKKCDACEKRVFTQCNTKTATKTASKKAVKKAAPKKKKA